MALLKCEEQIEVGLNMEFRHTLRLANAIRAFESCIVYRERVRLCGDRSEPDMTVSKADVEVDEARDDLIAAIRSVKDGEIQTEQ
jgi:hypothetical protein